MSGSRELERACGQALYAGARAAGAGTRQQVRAAVRRFLRRHRSDRPYLRRVLRAVLASSALAALLLGLAAEPASAKGTLFAERVGPANPLDGEVVGQISRPALGDFDGDGDLDAVVVDTGSAFRAFENTGSATLPGFDELLGTNNPLDGLDPGFYSRTPALGDLDGDGDLDLVVGQTYGGFFYYQNVGSATAPAFAELVGTDNPLAGQDAGTNPVHALGDLDGDGDLDLVSGDWLSHIFSYFENTGDAATPGFVARTGSDNPFAGHFVGGFSAPGLGDLDGDGDLDLVEGEFYGRFFSYENTGTATAPAFLPRTDAANPLAGADVGDFSSSALGDLDGDGDLDLVSGEIYGAFRYYENLAGNLLELTGTANPVGSVVASQYAHFVYGDLDDDGDLDLVHGVGDGQLFYLENTGSATAPLFVYIGTASPLWPTPDLGYFATPALGDLDGDGDLDLVAGSFQDILSYFENTGSAASPAFLERIGSDNPLGGELIGAPDPALADLDSDGDLDVLVGEGGAFVYLENTGSATSPAFIRRLGSGNPLDGQDIGSEAAPALGDLDGDLDLDLVAGEFSGSFFYFENTGGTTAPAFVPRQGSDNPLDGQSVEAEWAAPALADLDGDGDLDVTSDRMPGGFFYLENALLQPRALAFRDRTGLANPLDGESVDQFSAPTLGDLDGDGDLDLVAGEYDGSFTYYENTGGSNTPRFQPGLTNPLAGHDVGSSAAPALGDLDGDGDLDLIAGAAFYYYASVFYYENVGDATSPSFAPAAVPAGLGFGGYATPALGDLDRDGDLDVVVGTYYGTFSYFENVGSATNPSFTLRFGTNDPLSGQDVGSYSAPSLGDVDGDGDLDLVAGRTAGTFHYLENTGDATTPLFVLRTGSANPLDGWDAGRFSTPALGDLDSDGDLDLVSGEVYGEFRTYYLPEASGRWLLGAGLALIHALERLRRRRSRESPG